MLNKIKNIFNTNFKNGLFLALKFFISYIFFLINIYIFAVLLERYSTDNPAIKILLSIDILKLIMYSGIFLLIAISKAFIIMFFLNESNIIVNFIKKILPFICVFSIILSCLFTLNEHQYSLVVTTLSFVSLFSFILKK